MIKLIEFLVKNKGDIHADSNWPIRYAAENGHLEVVKFLVEQGVDIHVGEDLALRYAARNGHLEVVEFLKSQQEVKEFTMEELEQHFGCKVKIRNPQAVC